MRRHVEVQEPGRDVNGPTTARGGHRTRQERLELAGRSVLGILGLTIVLLMLSAVLIAMLMLAFNWLVFGMVLGGLGE